MIRVTNLHKNFGGLEVLKGIDCFIEQQEVVCIIGPSGSGKSTFLRCLHLLEDITSGHIMRWDSEGKWEIASSLWKTG